MHPVSQTILILLVYIHGIFRQLHTIKTHATTDLKPNTVEKYKNAKKNLKSMLGKFTYWENSLDFLRGKVCVEETFPQPVSEL